MGFKPDQPWSHVESVNEFKDQVTDTLEEAKAALAKLKDDMTLYYNQKQTPALEFEAGAMVFLDASDIQTTRPSRKLYHRRLGPFPIDGQVGNGAYRLRFLCRWVDFIPSSMWSNYLWLLWTPFLADGCLCLPYQKLWMVRRSGW